MFSEIICHPHKSPKRALPARKSAQLTFPPSSTEALQSHSANVDHIFMHTCLRSTPVSHFTFQAPPPPCRFKTEMIQNFNEHKIKTVELRIALSVTPSIAFWLMQWNRNRKLHHNKPHIPKKCDSISKNIDCLKMSQFRKNSSPESVRTIHLESIVKYILTPKTNWLPSRSASRANHFRRAQIHQSGWFWKCRSTK